MCENGFNAWSAALSPNSERFTCIYYNKFLSIFSMHVYFIILTYMITDIITKRNTKAPPMDNPNIKGQSISSSTPAV
jgi:hypothetical protein